MAFSTKLSKSAALLLLSGVGFAVNFGAACSPQKRSFQSCDATRTCPGNPQAGAAGGGGEAGAAGKQFGGTSGGAGQPTAQSAAGKDNSAAGSDNVEACPRGTHNCAGDCVRDDSVDNCGARCEPCAAPSSGMATCEVGVCGLDCGDLKKCGATCTSGCCEDSDCTAQAGKAGKCDTSTN